MKITGTVEDADGAISYTEVDAVDYHAGYDALVRLLEDGTRLVQVLVER